MTSQARAQNLDAPDVSATRLAKLADLLTGARLTARLVPRRLAAAHHVTMRELTAVLIVAAAFRYIDLGAVGLNSDEAVYAGQSASLAGNPHFTSLFPIVRAHPLLMQLVMAPLYRSGVVDTPGRYVAATFGVATVALVYALGRVMYDHRVATVGALLLAVMPYH